MALRSLLVLATGLSCSLQARTWSLAGKVVDAEEGNGLNAVEVSLARAGLRATTAKNGTWSIDGVVGVHGRDSRVAPFRESFLHLDGNRLLLRMDGMDLLGRRMGGFKSLPPAPAAARGQANVGDTLVYTKDGYVQKRVALAATGIANILDSIRRIRYEGWVDSSHSNGFKPDTLDAFSKDTLRKITFRFAKRDWDSLFQAMTDSCGAFGASSGGGWGASTTCQVSTYDLIDNNALIWVPADMLADGQVWRNVAIRLKGNASLQSSWSEGSYSLPFRINTDKFEDSFPTIKNQRFHGFKKLSFYNSEQDSTSIRGPIASQIFREAGVVAPITVPVQLSLDRGDGKPLDVGLYEMVEVPDNPLLNRYFDNDSGTLYKPLSKLDQYVAAEWEDPELETDYADAKNLIAVVNAANRTTDTAAWHKALEAVLDVDGFLNWLAVSTAIMNWDAYGTLAHNYFMFDDSGTFRWITYDFGWSFDYSMGLLPRNTIWYDGSSGGWGMSYGPFPLVKNLLADKTYCEKYRASMTRALAGPVTVANFQAKVDHFGKLVSAVPKTVNAVKTLRAFMTTRVPEINTSLSGKTCPIK